MSDCAVEDACEVEPVLESVVPDATETGPTLIGEEVAVVEEAALEVLLDEAAKAQRMLEACHAVAA